MGLLDKIPGYRAAVERENALRDAAFLDLPERICGFEVRPLTPSLFIALDGAGSPFVSGGPAEPADVSVFLWAISTEYTRCDEARSRFITRTRAVEFSAACKEISDYLADAFQDCPPTSAAEGCEIIPYASWTSAVIDLLASEYGWGQAEILGMPLKCVFQYVRRIQKRRNPGKTLFNRSDTVRGDWLRRVNAMKGDNV